MKTSCEKRLDKSFRNAPVLPLYPGSKLVLFSDCHRGVGNSNDNFLKNQHLYLAALRHYYDSGFIYIELGDGDELWENRSLSAIREIHSNVFELLSKFAHQNRLYMLYGNHDHALSHRFEIPPNGIMGVEEFPRHAGLILKLCGFPNHDSQTGHRTPHCLELYLTHGHQADLLNSTLWKFARFLVRYIWKPMEQIGILDPTSAAKNYQHRQRSEKRLSNWAVKNNCYLICGHTHRPMLGSPETRYFNTGSCVHPHCVTCIEIENGAVSLVKWLEDTTPERLLYVSRCVLGGPLLLWEL